MSIVPALKLKQQSEIRRVSALRSMLDAESFWPSEILEQPYVKLETTTGPLLFLTGPDLVQAAIMEPSSRLPRSRLQQRFAGNGTGRENVITDTGNRSQVHRRSLAPLFKAQMLPGYFSFVQQTIKQAIDPWFQAADTDISVDVIRGSVHATFGVIWQIMFGEAGKLTPPNIVFSLAESLFNAGATNRLRATSEAIEYATKTSLQFLPDYPLAPGTPFSRVPPEGLQLTEQEKVDNVRFLITAGHESTALTISWAMLMLALHPELQESIATEVRNKAGFGPITLQSLRQMHQLGRVLDETMRLYPAAIVVNREAAIDLFLGDLSVSAGTQVAICFYGMHRHRSWWDNPDDFDPGRFDPVNKRIYHPSAFMPFSAGAHSCLGGHLAWTEAMLVLANTLRDMKFTLKGDVAKPLARYTLRPDRPILLNFMRRY
ncbi:cytochrome P450 [Thalassospira sp. NFXS8]|uniref:cytochrome P450 n=1 Tax=Thalassospira sp. NFXS8 TaxID=2819093 RepID=UPI0032DEEF40